MIGTCWCAETTGDKTAAPDEPLSETAVVVVVITLDLSGLLQLPPITSVEREGIILLCMTPQAFLLLILRLKKQQNLRNLEFRREF